MRKNKFVLESIAGLFEEGDAPKINPSQVFKRFSRIELQKYYEMSFTRLKTNITAKKFRSQSQSF